MGRVIVQILLVGVLGISGGISLASNYTPPVLKSAVTPKYPIDRFSKANEESVDEGLVEILYMVNEQGQTFAPKVLRASMDRFIEPALKALDKYEYEPATLDGAPVQAQQQTTLDFKIAAADLRSARGSTSGFTSVRERGVPDGYQSHYDEFSEAIATANPDQAHLQTLLDLMIGLKHQSFYSLAYHSLARFRFAEKFQGSKEKMKALEDLVWFNPYIKGRFQILQDDLEGVIWSNLLKLQIESGAYAQALHTNARLLNIDPKLSAPFADYIEQIKALKASDQFTQQNFMIGESGTYSIPLLKRSFTFTELNKNLKQLDLYCQSKKATLEFVADAQYQLPEKWGNCVLSIDADSGTHGSLLEQ